MVSIAPLPGGSGTFFLPGSLDAHRVRSRTTEAKHVTIDTTGSPVGTTGAVKVSRFGRVALVTFDRPDDRVNALAPALMRDLIAAARALDDAHDTSAVVFTGKPGIFSAGFDLKDAAARGLTDAELEERRAVALLGPRLIDTIAQMAPVTLAAIEGPCMGGGLAFAAVMDFRIGAQSSRYAAPEVERGLSMGWRSVPRLVGLLGVPATRRLVLKGDGFSAAEAQLSGLLDEVVADGDAMRIALRWGQHFAGRPAAQLKMAKLSINAAAFHASVGTATLDADQFLAAAGSPEFRATVEGMAPRVA